MKPTLDYSRPTRVRLQANARVILILSWAMPLFAITVAVAMAAGVLSQISGYGHWSLRAICFLLILIPATGLLLAGWLMDNHPRTPAVYLGLVFNFVAIIVCGGIGLIGLMSI